MLFMFSTVHDYAIVKLNSQAYITKPYHEEKPLPLVLKQNCSHTHFTDTLHPLRIGPYQILGRFSDVTKEPHTPRNHSIP